MDNCVLRVTLVDGEVNNGVITASSDNAFNKINNKLAAETNVHLQHLTVNYTDLNARLRYKTLCFYNLGFITTHVNWFLKPYFETYILKIYTQEYFHISNSTAVFVSVEYLVLNSISCNAANLWDKK